jgi:hypothetical protein
MVLRVPSVLPHGGVIVARKVDTLQPPGAGGACLAEKAQDEVPHLQSSYTSRLYTNSPRKRPKFDELHEEWRART